MSSSLEPSAPDRPAPLDHPERPLGVDRSDSTRAWPWWVGLLGFVAALAATAILGVVVVGIASLAGVDTAGGTDDLPPGLTIALTFVQDAVFIATPVLLVLLVVGSASRGAFGLRAPRRLGAAAGLVAGTYVGFLLFTALWTSALDITQPQDTLDQLGATSSAGATAATAVLVCIGAPIGEELLFRGLIFTSLRRLPLGRASRRWGLPVAMALTGIIFGAVHFDGSSASVGYLVPLALFGAALCFLYWRTGSLYPCIALHALNNSIAFGTGVGWDWQIPLLVVGALGTLALLAVAFERTGARARPAAPARG